MKVLHLPRKKMKLVSSRPKEQGEEMTRKKYMLVYVVTGFAVITFFVFIFYMYLRICQRQPHTRMINLVVI